ncbi:proline-specific peptidase [Secundilactobacillus odoratitofui DSM 19909 = JCM 15043]|uniref:Proline iminopeptidase n=1 Tax=Secundilactobacillus odoratitofui DSM 19909 = JCM 15043 TaxID=1423776 RepID=A0A0R1M079_9LACO|nr:proline iminopeptidase-family hydrolase [Secundilactobacillus odoratitofui]KRK97399.1 proline-specific peptidase [Secundilactobacillus odoratitofui DSM 19909 = JCM 15043]
MHQGSRIVTLKNGFHLFTRTVGEGDVNLLCVHGGPGGTHEEFENFAEHLADHHVRVSMYDQLGSFYSDQPDYTKPENRQYLTIDYYLSELEEVRQQLGLDHFYLLGHSWGGLLAQEYALRYPEHLKGLVVMSMIDNLDEYIENINRERDETLSKRDVAYMKEVEADERFDDPKYRELVDVLNNHFAMRHPENGFSHNVETMATPVYNYFQGDNEFVMVGKLTEWDRRADTHKIKTPTLLTFGDHDTMPLDTAERMHREMSNSRLVYTPDGGHCHSTDNPKAFFHTLGEFLDDVEAGTFNQSKQGVAADEK